MEDTNAIATSTAGDGVTPGAYLKLALLLTACGAWLVAVTSGTPKVRLDDRALIAPISALVGFTGAVCLLMTIVRNLSVILGLTSAGAYVKNHSHTGPDWIERPARTFDNLMQVPMLFYLACVLSMLTHTVDRVQLMLAWTFVALRVAHAVVYVGWNPLHYRFGTWIGACIVLATMWIRFWSAQ